MAEFLAKTPEQLGSILRGYRQQRGLTQQQLAASLGLPQKYISLAETRPARLTVARLYQLLGALQVELRVGDGASAGAARAEW